MQFSTDHIHLKVKDAITGAKWYVEHFGIKTDNLDAVWSILVKAWTQILSPIQTLQNGARIFFTKGPDNVLIELLEYSYCLKTPLVQFDIESTTLSTNTRTSR